jgi:hypothetical protein
MLSEGYVRIRGVKEASCNLQCLPTSGLHVVCGGWTIPNAGTPPATRDFCFDDCFDELCPHTAFEEAVSSRLRTSYSSESMQAQLPLRLFRETLWK